MARNDSEDVKKAVANHLNTNARTLQYLGTSSESSAAVVEAVVDNWRTQDETYEEILQQGKWDLVLASSKRTPNGVMERLAQGSHLDTQNIARAALDVRASSETSGH